MGVVEILPQNFPLMKPKDKTRIVDDLLEVETYTLKIFLFYGKRDRNPINLTEGSYPNDDLPTELSKKYDDCPAYYQQMAQIEQKNESPVTTMKCASDGKTWCTGHKYGSVKLWTIRTDDSNGMYILEEKQCIFADNQLITSVTFSSNSEYMAYSTEYGDTYVLKRQKIRDTLDHSWKGTELGASGNAMKEKRLKVVEWLIDCDLIIEDLSTHHSGQDGGNFVACRRLDFLKFKESDIHVLAQIQFSVQDSYASRSSLSVLLQKTESNWDSILNEPVN